jgi:hypothetical protein
MGIAAVITLSALLIAVVTFAALTVREHQQIGNIWEARWSELKGRLDEEREEYAVQEAELEVRIAELQEAIDTLEGI